MRQLSRAKEWSSQDTAIPGHCYQWTCHPCSLPVLDSPPLGHCHPWTTAAPMKWTSASLHFCVTCSKLTLPSRGVQVVHPGSLATPWLVGAGKGGCTSETGKTSPLQHPQWKGLLHPTEFICKGRFPPRGRGVRCWIAKLETQNDKCPLQDRSFNEI